MYGHETASEEKAVPKGPHTSRDLVPGSSLHFSRDGCLQYIKEPFMYPSMGATGGVSVYMYPFNLKTKEERVQGLEAVHYLTSQVHINIQNTSYCSVHISECYSAIRTSITSSSFTLLLFSLLFPVMQSPFQIQPRLFSSGFKKESYTTTSTNVTSDFARLV